MQLDDLVITSRIRLARNIEDMPFPAKLKDARAKQITQSVFNAAGNTGSFRRFDISDLSEIEGRILVEKHLISADLLNNRSFGAALISDDETVSIMVNEEDHIRAQVILPGFMLEQAFEKVNYIDDCISKKVKYAFSPKLGYLTACPTNVGTGMRASVMMFLPGLAMTNSLEQCVAQVSRLNMAVRGVYGEGSKAEGYIYQLSNQKTLGLSENEIIEAVSVSINHIAQYELRARDTLKKDEDSLKDAIYRAWGVLTNAYSLESQEFMKLIALIKLGGYFGYINISHPQSLQKLITNVQPANILKIVNESFSASERDILRASYVAKTISSMAKKAVVTAGS